MAPSAALAVLAACVVVGMGLLTVHPVYPTPSPPPIGQATTAQPPAAPQAEFGTEPPNPDRKRGLKAPLRQSRDLSTIR